MLNQIKGEYFKEKETIKDLISHNNYLMSQAVRRDDKVTDLKALMKDLQKLANKLSGSFDSNKRGVSKKQSYYWYCWTRGRTGLHDYTSATCNRPKEGHVKTVTIYNLKRGSNDNCNLWSESGSDNSNNLINNITYKWRLNPTHHELNSTNTPNFDSTKHMLRTYDYHTTETLTRMCQ